MLCQKEGSYVKTKVEFLCVPISDEERELDFLDALSYTSPRTIHSKEKKKKKRYFSTVYINEKVWIGIYCVEALKFRICSVFFRTYHINRKVSWGKMKTRCPISLIFKELPIWFLADSKVTEDLSEEIRISFWFSNYK